MNDRKKFRSFESWFESRLGWAFDGLDAESESERELKNDDQFLIRGTLLIQNGHCGLIMVAINIYWNRINLMNISILYYIYNVLQ